MTSKHVTLAAFVALFGFTYLGLAHSGTSDYEFRLVQNEAKQGEAVLAVHLVDKRTGKAVSDAVIFAKRIDMEPDGMPTMASAIEQVGSDEPGVYRFKTKLTMAGGWRLSLGAKVQGETGTVESKLVLKVTE